VDLAEPRDLAVGDGEMLDDAHRPELLGVQGVQQHRPFIPLPDLPVPDDAVEHEGIALCELLGRFAGGEDRHRSLCCGSPNGPCMNSEPRWWKFMAAGHVGVEVGAALRLTSSADS
jgi:hypothetical protein